MTKFHRNTKQRQVVLEELRCLTSHPTASNLYEIVRQRLPKISLGTVYRNLELLVQQGAIQKLEHAGSEARFDGNCTQHYHVRCVRCGRVDDAHDVPRDAAVSRIKDVCGYDVLEHRLEFIGICPHCKQDRRSASPGSTCQSVVSRENLN